MVLRRAAQLSLVLSATPLACCGALDEEGATPTSPSGAEADERERRSPGWEGPSPEPGAGSPRPEPGAGSLQPIARGPRPEPVAGSPRPEPVAGSPGPEAGSPEPGAPPPVFDPTRDATRRRALRESPVASARKGRGGRSLSFKVTLEDGTVGYFKPRQTFSAAHYWSEIAAYHLDRALGFGRVAPVVGRRISWGRLRAAARGDARIPEVQPSRDGTVPGAFIWWIPESLVRLRLPRGWERWVRLEPLRGPTPYQRPVDYRRALRGGSSGPEVTDRSRPVAGESPPTPERAAELSDLIVFDYLIQNVDRWGGDYTNVRLRGEGGRLLFFDNGAGFWPGEQDLGLMDARLRACQRFRPSTVEAVRGLDLPAYFARLETEGLGELLNERQREGLAARRDAFLAYVERLFAEHGERVYLSHE